MFDSLEKLTRGGFGRELSPLEAVKMDGKIAPVVGMLLVLLCGAVGVHLVWFEGHWDGTKISGGCWNMRRRAELV